MDKLYQWATFPDEKVVKPVEEQTEEKPVVEAEQTEKGTKKKTTRK